MIHKITLQNHKKFLLFICLMISIVVNAQIGIGTTTPDPSSILDVTSTTKGMLAPRMTTAQRLAMTTPVPADGLIVYDIDLRAFYYYILPTASWSPIGAAASGRTNFKRIKAGDNLSVVLAPELAIGGNKYVLNTNTLYEINGAVTFDKPIDLNNAYIQGLDSGEDKIVATGSIFVGNTGGSIKGLTLNAGDKVFSLSGSSIQNLIFRDCIVQGSNSVGTISEFGFVFISIVQFIGNDNGITYSNIGRLLLSNLGWFGNNLGTFEKLEGSFGLVQKQGGFSEVNGTAVGFDVSTNTLSITGEAILESVVFTGANTAGYVKPYALAQRYPGYNFSNAWTVDSPGIPRESDGAATGDINFVANAGSSVLTTFTADKFKTKINGNTTSNNLFRFTKDGENRITYRGNKPRYFQLSASVSYQGSATDMTLILYFAKNGVVLNDTKVYGRPPSGFFAGNGSILALPLVGTVSLNKGDYVEIWGERFDGSGNISTVSLNMTVR